MMNTLKPLRTIIVDDEPLAIQLVKELLSELPETEVIGTYTDPMLAVTEIKRLAPDLLILDIQMPRLSGIELLRSIRLAGFRFKVIFVTAYDQYAIEAIHEESFDYLLKPLDPEELKNSVKRLITRLQEQGQNQAVDSLLSRIALPRIQLTDRSGISFFNPDEIVYLEADGNYCKLHLKTREHLVTRKIGEMEDILASYGFWRINRSYIINPVFLSRIDHKLHICFLENGVHTIELPVTADRLKDF